jgi:DNA processing protein
MDERHILFLRLCSNRRLSFATAQRIFPELESAILGSKSVRVSALDNADLSPEAREALLATFRIHPQIFDRLRQKLEKAGASFILRGDDEYPERLTDSMRDHAPVSLFYKGNLELLNAKCVVVAGSRRVNARAAAVAMNAAKTLARRGFTVLTGGTTSSDKAAAEGALGAGGGCALFLAEGILKNKQPMAVLEKTSDDNWLVVSRFHPQRPQTRSDAALRNDLIFMAADAILLTQVIQSGSIFNAALTSLKRKKPAEGHGGQQDSHRGRRHGPARQQRVHGARHEGTH